MAQAATRTLSRKTKKTAVADAAAAAGQPPVLTVPAAAAQLGCSQMHIYRLITAGELRAVDISMPGAGRSKTRIRADDLADYIERQTRTA